MRVSGHWCTSRRRAHGCAINKAPVASPLRYLHDSRLLKVRKKVLGKKLCITCSYECHLCCDQASRCFVLRFFAYPIKERHNAPRHHVGKHCEHACKAGAGLRKMSRNLNKTTLHVQYCNMLEAPAFADGSLESAQSGLCSTLALPTLRQDRLSPD